MDTRSFYDRISGAYDLLADASERTCRDRGIGMLRVVPGERILEIGFGTGHALAALAAAAGPTGLVTGTDVSSGMLKMALGVLQGIDDRRIFPLLDDARSLCFSDGVFDAAFISFTLELFELADIAVVLSEIHRVLRSNGRLAIVAMAETDHTNTMIDLYQWLHRHFPHFVDCRPIKVRELLERQGFRATNAELMSVWGLPVACVVGVKQPKAHL